MKNVVLINAVDFDIKKSCNPFADIKESDVLKSKISQIENNISEKLNSLSSNRLKLAYQKKYKYEVIGKEGNNIGNSEFGAFFFIPSDVSPQYRVCLGPVVELSVQNKKGCNTATKSEEVENEKEKGCNTASNDGKKSAGCNPSITGGQYLNFQNNDKNSEYVKSINESKGWRSQFNQLIHDFTFTSYFSWSQENLKISIDEYYDLIIDAANSYIENLAKDNLNFECQLTLPATSDDGNSTVLENAIICSNTSKQSFYIERSSVREAYLSAFDLMYVESDDWFKKLSKIPKIGGVFEGIRSFILFIKKLFGNKPKVTDISSENLDSLQELYSTEFSEQITNIETIERLKANKVGSLNVFVLVPLWQSSFGLKWRKFWKMELHKRVTFEVDLTKRDSGNNTIDSKDSPTFKPRNLSDFNEASSAPNLSANDEKSSIKIPELKKDINDNFNESITSTGAIKNKDESIINTEKQKQGKGKNLTVILAILMLIILAGCIILYSKFSKRNSENDTEATLNTTDSITKITEESPVATSNSLSDEQTDTVTSTTEENQPISDLNDELIGEWKGAFGNDQLLINIESINDDGSVSGFNIVKNNKRSLSGFKNGTEFELKEPGDDKWDGVFKFSIIDNAAIGTWTANNGKLTKQFTLTK